MSNTHEESFPFKSLPFDLLIFIINFYVQPDVAFLCLRISKVFNRRLDRDKIIYRYLKKRSYDAGVSEANESAFCPLCNLNFQKWNKGHKKDDEQLQIQIKNHMIKHRRAQQTGKKMQMFSARPGPCDLCNAPYQAKHGCMMYFKKEEVV